MLKIGTQTKNVVCDENPEDGFQLLKKCGFDCCDFSLNSYLTNTDLYKEKLNTFFDKTDSELERFVPFIHRSYRRDRNKMMS